MTSQTRELQIASIVAWSATIVTSWYYFTLFPTPNTPTSIWEFTYPTRFGFAYNCVLNLIIGLTLYRGKIEGDSLRWIMIHFFTGLVLLFLSIFLSTQQTGLISF